MSNTYTVSFQEITVSAAQDLFEILAPSDAAIELLSAAFGQSSDAGDAEAEMAAIAIVRGEGSVTSGSGGAAVTPVPTEKGMPAAGATVERNNTTKMAVGTGALKVMENDTFNVQVGWRWVPVPEERPVISPGDRMTFELVSAPGDPLTMNGTVKFREIGG